MFLGKKKLLFTLVLLAAVVFSFSAPLVGDVWAQENTDQTTASGGAAANAEEGRGVVQFDTVGGWIYSGLTTIGGLVAMLGGGLLDISLSFFVVNMVGTMEAFGLDQAIQYLWALIRDLFNILFIFGIILIGFRIILGIDDSGAKRNLSSLLVAALLINFSLFITQTIIDFGNIAAVEISAQFADEAGSGWQILPDFKIRDLSSSFIAAAQLDTVSDNTLTMATDLATGRIELPQRTLTMADALGLGLVVALMFILIGFVFAAGALVMFTRFIYLFVLMVFSPVMFLGFVLPKFRGRAEKWWRDLLNQTLVGPAFLFMLWMSLYSLRSMRDALGTGEMGVHVFMLSSVLVAGFAWMSLAVARSFGGAGASTVVNLTKNAMGGATFGAVASFGRNTFGRWAQGAAESDRLRDRAAQSGASGWLARRQLSFSRSLGDASFDARQVGGAGKRLGIGEGQRGGYKTVTENIAKQEQQYAASLGTVSDDDVSVMRLKKALEETDKTIKERKEEIQNERKNLSSAPAAERDNIRARIESLRSEVEDLEEKKTKDTESLNVERYRRQVGSRQIPDSVKQEVESKEEALYQHKEELVSLEKNLKEEGLSPEQKIAIQSDIANTKKLIADTKKALTAATKEANKLTGGYAAKVESENMIKNFFSGRTQDQNKNVADAIRNEYKGKIKSK